MFRGRRAQTVADGALSAGVEPTELPEMPFEKHFRCWTSRSGVRALR